MLNDYGIAKDVHSMAHKLVQGMKTRELKAFLKKKGIFVDDCFDTDSSLAKCTTWLCQLLSVGRKG